MEEQNYWLTRDETRSLFLAADQWNDAVLSL